MVKYQGNPPCNVCGAAVSRFLFQKNGYSLVKCTVCGLAFISNPPSGDKLKEIYSFAADYHTGFQHHAAAEPDTVIAEEHYRILSKYKQSGNLLDVGCSVGMFLNIAKRDGWNVSGIEFSEDTAAIARNKYGLDVKTSRLNKGIFKETSFDAITLWDMIEHDTDPMSIMQIVHELLKENGVLCLSTPNIDGLFPRLSYLIAHLVHIWRHPEPPYHLFQFSVKTITDLLQRSGFKALKVYHARMTLSYSFGTWSSLSRSPLKFLYALIFAPMAWIGPYIRSGDEIIVVARKYELDARPGAD